MSRACLLGPPRIWHCLPRRNQVTSRAASRSREVRRAEAPAGVVAPAKVNPPPTPLSPPFAPPPTTTTPHRRDRHRDGDPHTIRANDAAGDTSSSRRCCTIGLETRKRARRSSISSWANLARREPRRAVVCTTKVGGRKTSQEAATVKGISMPRTRGRFESSSRSSTWCDGPQS